MDELMRDVRKGEVVESMSNSLNRKRLKMKYIEMSGSTSFEIYGAPLLTFYLDTLSLSFSQSLSATSSNGYSIMTQYSFSMMS